jgi:hypothetical protein
MKKNTLITIGLAAFLLFRLVGLSSTTFLLSSSGNLSRPEFSIIFIVLYIASLITLFTKPKWGAILVMVTGILDIIVAISYTSGDFATGVLISDAILIGLGFLKYKEIK